MKPAAIPGLEEIERGMADLASGRETPESLLVEIAAPRLRFLGYQVPAASLPAATDPEIRLYRLLGTQGDPDPYRAYNALLRRLGRTCRALESRIFRARRSAIDGPPASGS
jgi:hypothetical protein